MNAHKTNEEEDPQISKSCGATLRDDARFCEHCGAKVEPSAQAGQPSYSQPYADPSQSQGNSYNNTVQNAPAQGSGINDYLVGNIILSVLALLCCACPSLVTGIIGIVFSSQVKSALSAGTYDEAALLLHRHAQRLFGRDPVRPELKRHEDKALAPSPMRPRRPRHRGARLSLFS